MTRLHAVVLAGAASVCLLGHARAEPQWQFDPDLVRGTTLGAGMLQRFNRAQALLPGTYPMELYVNAQFVTRMDIRFAEQPTGEVQPCFNQEQWRRAGVPTEHLQEVDGDCPALAAQVLGSHGRLDAGRLQLWLTVPGVVLRQRDTLPLDALDKGSSLLFLNYMGHVWHSERSGGVPGKHQDSGYLSLSGGINLGLWQYRQQGHWSLSNRQSAHWHNVRASVQRPLPGLAGGSQLTLGQLYTSGHFFSGLSYYGLRLASDERWLADQQRGFAPVVRGVANSNAVVSIRQKGQEIYRTTVAPGAFVIDDLAPTSYNGELEVRIEEADGSTRQFKVPFSALPESLRPGHLRYALATGRSFGHQRDSGFADASVRLGLSNQVSAGAGVRAAGGYQAVAADAVYLSRVGAIGVSLNHSRAQMRTGHHPSGRMMGVSYSRTFAPTQTHLSIATYRYSTSGYRELGDLLGERGNSTLPMPGEQQRARFDISISQTLSQYGHVFVSGSNQNWHHSHRHDRQWQLGYGIAWSNGINLSLSLMRQSHAALQDGRLPETGARASDEDTQFNLSLSMPLGGASRPSLSQGFSRDHRGHGQYDASVSGRFDDGLSYQLGTSATGTPRQFAWHGNLQQRLPSASLGINASRGRHHWQMSGNAQGALVVHGGGLTFGPWLGETFALIEAKGAHGASLGGAGQARIDRHGYALMPSLTPYRNNRVFLDPQGAAGNVELEAGEQQTAPYPGAAVKLIFHTRRGQALLIHVNTPGGQALPPGAEAFDDDGKAVGMLGQGNWLYLRSEHGRGQLQVRWGDGDAERCMLGYDTHDLPDAPLPRLQAECVSPLPPGEGAEGG